MMETIFISAPQEQTRGSISKIFLSNRAKDHMKHMGFLILVLGLGAESAYADTHIRIRGSFDSYCNFGGGVPSRQFREGAVSNPHAAPAVG